MRVDVDNLIEGCILTDVVISKTNRPIISKKTVLSAQLIEVIKAFLIKEVEVENTLVSGVPFNAPRVGKDQKMPGNAQVEKNPNLNFIDLFLRAKKSFKKEF
ncbi:MAG TPA: phosphohydrolase, partial [Bacillus bacterium]|nr:phosphohydrolase [Bacillus sp. (in: firmicutes)]